MKQLKIYLIVAGLFFGIALLFTVYVWVKLQSLDDTKIHSSDNVGPNAAELREFEGSEQVDISNDSPDELIEEDDQNSQEYIPPTAPAPKTDVDEEKSMVDDDEQNEEEPKEVQEEEPRSQEGENSYGVDEPIEISEDQLSDAQKATLKALGVDTENLVITPEMITCAESEVGEARLNEILEGASPGFFESIKLLGCMN